MKKTKILLVAIILLLSSFSPTISNAAQKYYRIQADVCYKVVKGEKLPLYIKGYKNSSKVTWKSSNSKIASVNKKGIVTAKKGGTVVIKATIGNKVYKTTVTVITGKIQFTKQMLIQVQTIIIVMISPTLFLLTLIIKRKPSLLGKVSN